MRGQVAGSLVLIGMICSPASKVSGQPSNAASPCGTELLKHRSRERPSASPLRARSCPFEPAASSACPRNEGGTTGLQESTSCSKVFRHAERPRSASSFCSVVRRCRWTFALRVAGGRVRDFRPSTAPTHHGCDGYGSKPCKGGPSRRATGRAGSPGPRWRCAFGGVSEGIGRSRRRDRGSLLDRRVALLKENFGILSLYTNLQEHLCSTKLHANNLRNQGGRKPPMGMSRRSFVAGAAGAVSGLCAPLIRASAQGLSEPSTRYDVATPEGEAMLEKYARAVAKMMDNTQTPERHPRSWLFQWYTHAVDPERSMEGEVARLYGGAAPSDPQRLLALATWNTCQSHGANGLPQDERMFLPWHRMYLYHFERISAKSLRTILLLSLIGTTPPRPEGDTASVPHAQRPALQSPFSWTIGTAGKTVGPVSMRASRLTVTGPTRR